MTQHLDHVCYDTVFVIKGHVNCDLLSKHLARAPEQLDANQHWVFNKLRKEISINDCHHCNHMYRLILGLNHVFIFRSLLTLGLQSSTALY